MIFDPEESLVEATVCRVFGHKLAVFTFSWRRDGPPISGQWFCERCKRALHVENEGPHAPA